VLPFLGSKQDVKLLFAVRASQVQSAESVTSLPASSIAARWRRSVHVAGVLVAAVFMAVVQEVFRLAVWVFTVADSTNFSDPALLGLVDFSMVDSIILTVTFPQ
jgi:hypothetical protein